MYSEHDRLQVLVRLNNKRNRPIPYSDHRQASAYRMAIDDCYYAMESETWLQYPVLQADLSKLISRTKHRLTIKEGRAYEQGVLACKSILSSYNRAKEANYG